MNNQKQLNSGNPGGKSSKDIGEEFGTKLSINPNLPINTDYSNGQIMDTPASFKCNTPTTPFGLSNLQFPGGIMSHLSNYALPTPLGNSGTPDSMSHAAEELFNLMPRTPLIPGGNLTFNYNFMPSGLIQQKSAQVSNAASPEPSQSQSSKPKTKKAGTKMKRARNSQKDESRWKSWTREEEVFLVGAVMDRFFKRGSLSSSKADDLNSDDSWSVIKKHYETSWKNYFLRTGISAPTERPANALSRHYKVMKARISQNDISGEGGENFRTFFDEWEKIYNVDNCLVSDINKNKIPTPADFAKRKVRRASNSASPSFRPQ